VRPAPEPLVTVSGRLCLVVCRLPVLLQQPTSPGPQDVVHCLHEDITPALSESARGLHDLSCVGHELVGPPRRSTRPRRRRQTRARLWVAPCTPVRAAPPAPEAECEHRVSRTCLDCFAAAPNQGASMLRTDRVQAQGRHAASLVFSVALAHREVCMRCICRHAFAVCGVCPSQKIYEQQGDCRYVPRGNMVPF